MCVCVCVYACVCMCVYVCVCFKLLFRSSFSFVDLAFYQFSFSLSPITPPPPNSLTPFPMFLNTYKYPKEQKKK